MPTSNSLSVFLALVVSLVAARVEAQELSATHLQAAEAVLVEANTEAVMDRATDEMLRLQIEQNPGLAPFEDVMRAFFAEFLSWQALRTDMVRLYATAFSEAELNEIAAFYRTPTGQKAVATMPGLMAEGMQMGQRAVQEQMPELIRRIQQRAAELESED